MRGGKWKGRAVCVLLAALALLPVSAAHAWDSNGHEQIADIAWVKLSPAIRIKVGRILAAGDPAFRPAGASEESVRDAFRRAATFPDEIKRNHGTLYEPIVDSMNRTWLPAPDLSDREQERCKTWHYYDTPIGANAGAPGPRPSNAFKALKRARHELALQQKSRRPDLQMQCWWLYWTEHLVGDLHQPLHCASSFRRLASGDAGGNAFPLGIPDPGRPGKNENLHFYWDQGIDRAVAADPATALDYAGRPGPRGVEHVTRRWTAGSSAPTLGEARSLDILSWIAAGARLADTQVYAVAEYSVPSPEYDAAQTKQCRGLALLAGTRLATMLTQALR